MLAPSVIAGDPVRAFAVGGQASVGIGLTTVLDSVSVSLNPFGPLAATHQARVGLAMRLLPVVVAGDQISTFAAAGDAYQRRRAGEGESEYYRCHAL